MSTAGAFVRQQAKFRCWPEPGAPPSRYHLYVALACPWSHRTVIVRKLAGVDLGISYAHPYRDERGWRLISDEINGFEFLAEAYQTTQPSVADTVAMDEIREHYYTTHDSLNPKRIIPRGPLDLDFTT